MDFELAQALANTALVVGSALVLWWFWRREAAKLPPPLEPLSSPPVPPTRLLEDLAAAQSRTAELLREARRQLERVERAFETGLRDGRTR